MSASVDFLNFLAIVLVAPLALCFIVGGVGYYFNFKDRQKKLNVRKALCFSHAKLLAKKGKMVLLDNDNCYLCKKEKNRWF